MKKLILMTAVIALMVSPVFSAATEGEKAALKTEITEQIMKVGGAQDTFWTGVGIGVVGAAVLVPVSMLFEDKKSKEYKMVLISAGGVAATSAVCMLWGGIEWALCGAKLDELKNKEKQMTIAPYFSPLAGNDFETGIKLDIEL